MLPPSKAQSPMKYMVADLFDAAGEKWIVLVDILWLRMDRQAKRHI